MKMNPEVTGAEIVVAESNEAPSIIRAVSSSDVSLAISEYQRIQSALDKALPDCIMQIQGRSFRKKDYWRAVATAFNLQVEEVSGSEHIERKPDGEILSASVTYRAGASNGRSATGDGACEAQEKAERQRTLHNIRAHAHTRAYNRAVSNLVGFGEVSAEEILDAPVKESGGGRAQQTHPGTEKARPSSPPSGDGPPWLDDEVGFGQFKNQTWRDFLSAKQAGVEWLEWYVQQEAKGRVQEENHRRASAVLDMRAASE